MSRGSFQIIDHDITNETCSEILEWTGKWRSRGLSDKWINFITSYRLIAVLVLVLIIH